MNTLLQLIAGFATFVLRAISFGRPHRLLPEPVRAGSAGYNLLLAGYVLAAVLRHHCVAGASLTQTVASVFLFLSVVVFFTGRRLAGFACIYFGSSIGVDLVLATAGLMGADITTTAADVVGNVWEWSAAFICAGRMGHDRAKQRAASGDH